MSNARGNITTQNAQKNPERTPKYANCGENHTASYTGCRSWLRPKKQTSAKSVVNGVFYADAAKPNTQPTPNMSLTELITFFQNMYSQMQEVAKKLSEMFSTSKPSQELPSQKNTHKKLLTGMPPVSNSENTRKWPFSRKAISTSSYMICRTDRTLQPHEGTALLIKNTYSLLPPNKTLPHQKYDIRLMY